MANDVSGLKSGGIVCKYGIMRLVEGEKTACRGYGMV